MLDENPFSAETPALIATDSTRASEQESKDVCSTRTSSSPVLGRSNLITGSGNIENSAALLPNSSLPNARNVSPEKVSLDSIAKRLLDERFLLTALEFYTELTESGRDSKRLRDFFSNPSNFEFRTYGPGRYETPFDGTCAGLARASSAQTLDSLDYCHNSDDGRQYDEKVAVLEFELRKSNDVIKELRSQLTTVSESSTFTAGDSKKLSSPVTMEDFLRRKQQFIKVHEKKALNFLINEYLLQNGYKLTAVCFSDEVADQVKPLDELYTNTVANSQSLYFVEKRKANLREDFDSWDDVGLNISRPDDLLTLYRLHSSHSLTFYESQKHSVGVQIDSSTDVIIDLKGSSSEAYRLEQLVKENAQLDRINRNMLIEIQRLQEELNILQKLTPCSFKNALFASVYKVQMCKGFDKTIIKIASKSSDLIELLSKLLRSIMNSLPQTQKQELIPLILSLAVLHHGMQERDILLNYFFKLFKKPDDVQRRMLLVGCAEYVKCVGPIRAESELLPQCWEHIGDKSVERRLLVAELCGFIAPHLPPSLLSSLLLSTLKQMMDDKSEHVREAVVKSLAIVCNYIDDSDKFGQMCDLLQRAITDNADIVITAARSTWVPALSFWALELDSLTRLLNIFAKRVEQIISEKTHTFPESTLCIFINSMQRMNNALFVDVITRAPFYNDIVTKAPSMEEISSNVGRFSRHDIRTADDLYNYFPNKNLLYSLTSEFDTCTSKEWYQTWQPLEFVYKNYLPHFVSVLRSVGCSNLNRLVVSCVAFLRHICCLFGTGFSQSKINGVFLENCAFIKHASAGSKFLDEEDFACINSCIFPAYISGVLATFEKVGTNAVSMPLTIPSFNEPACDICLSIVSELLIHSDVKVRRFCSVILCKIVKGFNNLASKSRALSSLISLASDSDASVKLACLSGFVSLLETDSYSPEFSDKLIMQMNSFFDNLYDNSGLADITPDFIRLFAQSAPFLEPGFRDEYLLPQLALLAARNNVCPNAEQKSNTAAALFECYSALSCCYLGQSIVRDHFLPGLKSLLKDLDSERLQIASSIIRDLESKNLALMATPDTSICQRRNSPGFTAANETVDIMKSRMFNKFKDFKDKMEQHKETVPRLFGVKK